MKRRKLVKYLYENGKTLEEIAENMGLPVSIIVKDFEFIKKQEKKPGEKQSIHQETTKQNKLEKQKEDREKRRTQVKALYNQGKTTAKEIYLEMPDSISIGTIRNDIKYLKEHGEIIVEKEEKQPNRNNNTYTGLTAEQVMDLCNNPCRSLRRRKDELTKYIAYCRNRFYKGTLPKEEIPAIREAVGITETYPDVAFYLRVCMQFGEFEQAIYCANRQINEKSPLTPEEKAKIKEVKGKIQELYKRHIAVEVLKREGGVQNAMRESGLEETTVIALNRNLIKKGEK